VEPGFSAGFLAEFSPANTGKFALTVRFPERGSSDADALDDAYVRQLGQASKLNHINVAQVFDVGKLEGRIHVASEFIDGISLDTVIDHLSTSGTPLPHDVAAFLVGELCAGLAYAHGRRDERGQPMGIVHGNIQSTTVLLSRAGEVKLVDFGFTQARQNVGLGPIHGAVRFMAPEIVDQGGVTVASDVYAVGVLAWCLLTGGLPWPDVVGDAVRERVRTEPIAPLRSVDSSIPDELASVIDAALSRDPADRPRSATDVRSALSNWLRTASPGFGRHRLKAWMQKEMSAAYGASQLTGDYAPLHRKDYRPADATSLIHAAASIQDGFTEKPALASLLTVSAPAVPARRPGAAPIAVPGKPAGMAAANRPAARPAPPVPTPAEESVFASRSFDDLDADADDASEFTHDDAPDVAPAPTERVAVPVRTAAMARPVAPAATRASAGDPDPDSFASSVEDDGDVVDLRPMPTRGSFQFGPWVGLVAIIGACAVGWYAWVTYVITPEALAAPDHASVFVTSRPQGATIQVDGVDTGRTTPALIPQVDPGTRVSITVALPGYNSPAAQDVEATAIPQQELTFNLQPEPHTIRVDSDPTGATVMLDGVAVGLTPYTIGPINADYRNGVDIVLRAAGYFDDPVAINWEAGEAESSVRRTLQPDPSWVPPEPVEDAAP
jgi:hypothetical protein